MAITKARVPNVASLVIRHGLLMREAFSVAHTDMAHWFPGHMARGLKKMQTKLKSVDCVIEVHDARIPVSGRNPQFEKRLGLTTLKPHLLVLNKMDLIDMSNKNRIMRYYADQGINNIIFTNCKKPDSKGIKSIIPKVSKLIRESERFNRSEEASYQLMVIGIPNVGKSSLINALRAKHLRRGKATLVGGIPGITQSVLERIKVYEDPTVYLLDTPGVMVPKIKSVEMGLKLALAATIKDHLVGEIDITDYLLYKLNYAGRHSYVDYLKVDEPTDNIQQLLKLSAVRHSWIKKIRDHRGMTEVPDTLLSAGKFLKGFRTGAFGTIILDDIPDPLQK
ncbi:hypothetical protein Pcinc_026784 [Petrolisthes cinctipes]|uniref:Mitochondrial GTPase 1 n=1 Tax=Petrolisthes cinctipes TaxID=88211 RepID=A0AAE1K9S2_PETCI|nr:hypothetical protein Pcinc_026784 [Petrolisthes cinctipes]